MCFCCGCCGCGGCCGWLKHVAFLALLLYSHSVRCVCQYLEHQEVFLHRCFKWHSYCAYDQYLLLHLVCEHRHHSILCQSSRTDWSSFLNRSKMVLSLFVAFVKSVIGFALILCFFATNFTLNLICQFHLFKCFNIFLFSAMMLFVSSLVGWSFLSFLW